MHRAEERLQDIFSDKMSGWEALLVRCLTAQGEGKVHGVGDSVRSHVVNGSVNSMKNKEAEKKRGPHYLKRKRGGGKKARAFQEG